MDNSELKNVSYAIGLSVAEGLQQQSINELNIETFSKGVNDVLSGKDRAMTEEEAKNYINDFFTKIQSEKFKGNIEEGKKFHEEMAQKEGVVTLESGLQYEILVEGDGQAKPTAQSNVTTHYHGTLIDGTVFDSSVARNEPASFGVGQVIRGWTEALQLMTKGAKWRLYVPQHLAYGANPHPQSPIEPYASLIFDVELIDFQ